MESKELDYLMWDISNAFYERNYEYLRKISLKAFGVHEKFLLISELSEKLPYMIFEAFLLINLDFLSRQSCEEWRRVIVISADKKVALYHIVKFLKSHGDMRNSHILNLGVEVGNMNCAFNDNMPNSKVEKINQILYSTYNVKKETLAKFKRIMLTYYSSW